MDDGEWCDESSGNLDCKGYHYISRVDPLNIEVNGLCNYKCECEFEKGHKVVEKGDYKDWEFSPGNPTKDPVKPSPESSVTIVKSKPLNDNNCNRYDNIDAEQFDNYMDGSLDESRSNIKVDEACRFLQLSILCLQERLDKMDEKEKFTTGDSITYDRYVTDHDKMSKRKKKLCVPPFEGVTKGSSIPGEGQAGENGNR